MVDDLLITMRNAALLVPVLVLLLLCTACQQASDTTATEVLTAAQLGEQEILPNSEHLREPRYAAADLERGARIAMQCRACHSFDPAGPLLLGPNPPTTTVITTPDRCGFIVSDAARFALPPGPG